MKDLLIAVKMKNNDGTYSDSIPFGVSADNVNWDTNHNLIDILGTIDLNKGDIQTQLLSMQRSMLDLDVTPTTGSSKPVTSGGIKAALDAVDAEIGELKENLNAVEAEIASIEPGLSENAKVALLNCFAHVAWTDEHGQTYYDALESALYADSYPRITALFTPGTHIVYTDDTLDSLKPYLTVEYYENAESSGVIIPSTNYALSGTLTEGSSTIIVSYNSVSTTFAISNVVDFYNIWRWEWNSSGGNLTKIHGSSEPGQVDLSMYPSGAALNSPYEIRRTYCTERGVAPYYEYLQTAVPTQYYPIPIPANANYVKVTTMPTGQFIYLTFYEFNGVKYDPRLGRTTWTEMSNGSFGRGLSLGSGNQRFLIFNMKYDSAGASYPVEPASMLIEFSEV